MIEDNKNLDPKLKLDEDSDTSDSVITYKDSNDPLIPDDPGLSKGKKILYIALAVWAVVALAAFVYLQSRPDDSNSTQDAITAAEQAAIDDAAPTASQKIAAIGEPAPEFSVKGVDGEITLDEYKDEPLLIEFIATWCPHCNKVAPRLQQALEIEPTESLMVGAANEPEKKVILFHEKYNLPGEVGFDDKDLTTITMYQGTGYPTLVFLDKDHEVVSIQTGEPSVSELVKSLELINGKN